MARSGFKDHFSRQAAEYARFRPRYPKELFGWLGSVAPGNELAWDCATGNGQAAVELAEVFERVIATDASEEQIANAAAHPRVEYRMATAEQSGLEPATVDLVTVAQALHWFDRDRFYGEIRRVLKPRGVLAAWAYTLAKISPQVDALVNHYYSEIVGPFWPPERALVEKFDEIPFPFAAVQTPSFEMAAEWSVGELLGYLRTWSATQRFVAAKGRDPLEEVEQDLRAAWGNQPRRVTWPLTVRAGLL
ncbi:MAG TPA: class I SAM-dependent methyltransferase [Chthoniobacterales bacterium]|nr:class I SAM-dependent methyltransferase [Chthoniobacterales bacterium]